MPVYRVHHAPSHKECQGFAFYGDKSKAFTAARGVYADLSEEDKEILQENGKGWQNLYDRIEIPTNKKEFLSVLERFATHPDNG